jgi:hypothetical protein
LNILKKKRKKIEKWIKKDQYICSYWRKYQINNRQSHGMLKCIVYLRSKDIIRYWWVMSNCSLIGHIICWLDLISRKTKCLPINLFNWNSIKAVLILRMMRIIIALFGFCRSLRGSIRILLWLKIILKKHLKMKLRNHGKLNNLEGLKNQ